MKAIKNEYGNPKQFWMLVWVVFFLCTGTLISLAQTNCVVDISRPGAVVADICRGQQIEESNCIGGGCVSLNAMLLG